MTGYGNKDDGTLVELTLIGEEEAFEELVERYENQVKQTAASIIGNPFSAEDVAQDTFLSAWLHLTELRSHDKFGAWVLRVARNLSLKLLKRYSKMIAELSMDMDSLPDTGEESSLSLREWRESERNAKLQAAVDALNSALRDTVKLHYLDGYSVREIAALLSVPEGTVLWRLSEGRKQLRRGFGIAEEGRDTLAVRVRRQVEALKLWNLKDDKSGFAETYEAVLSKAEDMDDSPEKAALLADLWLRESWWIPGKENDELIEKIRAAAVRGRNEDVMASLVEREIHFPLDKTLIPLLQKRLSELEEQKFTKAAGTASLWLAVTLSATDRNEESFPYFEKALSCLPPNEAGYAFALSSLHAAQKLAVTEDREKYHIATTGEKYVRVDGKWMFWSQPGYERGLPDTRLEATPFFWMSGCDRLIDDPSMKPGETRVSENGKITLTLRRADGAAETPAGRFEDCLAYDVRGGNDYSLDITTLVCPAVGIVRQIDRVRGVRFDLTEYRILGGGGRIPFAVGNRWRYHAVSDDPSLVCEDEQIYEIVYSSDDTVTAACSLMIKPEYDLTLWEGNMQAARNRYAGSGPDGEQILCEAEPYLVGMERLADTPRQKAITPAFCDAMRRILRSDPRLSPEGTRTGLYDFFGVIFTEEKDGNIRLYTGERNLAFEWRELVHEPPMGIVLCNFLYEIIEAGMGCVWDETWVPGFRSEIAHSWYQNPVKTTFSVREESVAVPAGVFASCRHISAEVAGGLQRWSGHLEFWYAEGVGPVKFLRVVTEYGQPFDAVWLLTEYRGTGEGFFPLSDGLFRRYEPENLPADWHAFVEYTFSEDQDGTVIIKNAGGSRDRSVTEAEQSGS